MAIQLYFSNSTPNLLDKLHENLKDEWQDPLSPPVLVVPNPNLGKWVKLKLTDKTGVTANLQGDYLERVFWNILAEVSKNKGEKVSMLDVSFLHIFILRLLDQKNLSHNPR